MGFNIGKVVKNAVKSVGNMAVGNLGAVKKNIEGAIGQDATNALLNTATKGLLNGDSTNLLSSLLGGAINWGNSIFSAKQAKEMAQWNSQLNYEYQTKLNQQAQAYDERMANTAVQRQMADLEKAGVNPAMASQYGGAGGGGLSGGTAQTDKADWLNLQLAQLAGQRDAQRVKIEQANSASSGTLMAAQEQQTLAEMAKTIKQLPYISKQEEANINNILASTVKTKAETAKSIAERNKIEQGIIANLIGTKASDTKKLMFEIGAGLIPGVGVGTKLYKGAKVLNTARKFGTFLKAM